MIRALVCLLLLLIAWPIAADEFKPAYLQLGQTGPTSYDVLWKVPAVDDQTTLKLRPVFPPGTVETSPRRGAFANGATVIRWTIEVPGGLEGKPVAFDGLSLVRTDILVRLPAPTGQSSWSG